MASLLLVEDDPMVAEIYMRKFTQAGFAVDNAKTGKEVLAMAKKSHYDIVLLDMVLPEMSGMEVLKELRSDPEYDPAMKVIIFSNLSDAQGEAMENGADGFIGKSQFSPSQIVVEVNRLLALFSEQHKNSRMHHFSEPQENGKKVLLIEDEAVFREMFGKKLEDCGFAVTYATNGAWGLKEAQQHEYDLIITDMLMPAMGGEAIVKNLRENKQTKDTPIIVISASVSSEDMLRVTKYNVEDYFVKTEIVPSDLSRRAEELLGLAE